ncbi:MAG TPA: 3'-5' exoribonuclease [Pseudonocardiaceae bacterium]|jgi:hypothetical protein|nr:3'-5' exoribonuclease [Pseudonocardiaceae bacterium]
MPRRIFYDFEFIEDGSTITPISVGMVDDAGRELYAVSTDFDPDTANEWVRQNVLAQLPDRSDPAWMPLDGMRARVLEFLAPTASWEDLELWGYYCAYDHVSLAQLLGPRMIDLPRGVPMFTRELMQLWDAVGQPPKPEQHGEHNALADARWNRAMWLICQAESQPQRYVVGMSK